MGRFWSAANARPMITNKRLCSCSRFPESECNFESLLVCCRWYYVRARSQTHRHSPCLLIQELSNVIADDDVGADVSERQKVLAQSKCRVELYHLSVRERECMPLIFLSAHIPSSAAILFCCCFLANVYGILILLR